MSFGTNYQKNNHNDHDGSDHDGERGNEEEETTLDGPQQPLAGGAESFGDLLPEGMGDGRLRGQFLHLADAELQGGIVDLAVPLVQGGGEGFDVIPHVCQPVFDIQHVLHVFRLFQHIQMLLDGQQF